MRPLTLALLLLLSACVPRDTVTRIEIGDPTQVSVEAGPDDEVLLPAGGEPREALLEEGRMRTGDGEADYSVNAVREADGNFGLKWETKVPLIDGERQPLFPEDHTYTLTGPASEVLPRRGVFHLEGCASLLRNANKHGYTGHSHTNRWRSGPEDWSCERDDGRAAFRLATPWSNVMQIRQTSTPRMKFLAWAMLPITLAIAAGGIAIAAHPHESMLGRVGGGALIGLGLLIQLPLTPSMAARTQEASIPVPRTIQPDEPD